MSHIKGITIEINGSTIKLEQALRNASKGVRTLQTELKNINKSLKFDPANTELINQKMKVLTEQVKESENHTKELKRLLDEMSKSPEKNAVAMREVARQLENAKKHTQYLVREQEKLKFAKQEAEIEKVNSSIKNTQTELKKVNDLLSKSPANIELIKQKQDLVKKSISDSNEKLKLLKKLEEDLSKDKGQADKWRDVKRQIVETEQSLKGYKKELEAVSNIKLASLKSSFDGISSKADSVARSTRGISTAAGVATAGATKLAIGYESAFAGVRKTTEATEEEFNKLSQGFRNMAKEIPTSASELANIGEIAGQLGIKKENILDFTRTIADLGVTTNLSTEEAATSLAQFMAVMGTGQDKVSNLGSAVVSLGNNFATSERDIVNMSQRLAPMGQLVGMAEADVLGLATSMSTVGIEAEAGGTAMTLAMKKIQNAVFDGGQKLENFAQTAGVSGEEFSQAFRDRPVEALNLLLKGLNKIQKDGGNVNSILAELGITGVRESQAITALAGALDGEYGLAKTLEIANQGFNENTALSKEAEERYKTTESQLKILKNTAVEFGISIGDALKPTIEKLTEKLKSLVEWFNNLSPAWKDVIAKALLFVTAISPIALGVSKVARSFSLLTGGIMKTVGIFGKSGSAIASFGRALASISKIGGLVKTAISGIGTAFNFLKVAFTSNPIGMVVVGLTTLGTVLYTLYQKSETFRNAVDKVFAFFKDTATSVYESYIKPLFEKLSQVWQTVTTAWNISIEFIKQIFSAVWDYLVERWNAFWSIFEPLFTGAWEAIKIAFETLWNSIKAIWDIFAGIFTGDWDRVWNGVKDLVTTIWEGIKNLFETIFDAIWETVSTIIEKIYKWIDEKFTAVSNFISETWGEIKETISEFVTKAWETVVEKVTEIYDSVAEWFGKIPGKISELWGEAVDFLKGIDLWQIGWDIISGLGNGIWAAAGWLWDVAKNIASGVMDTIKSFFGIASPARKMIPLGEFTGEGFAVGLANMEDEVNEVSENLGKVAMDALDDTVLSSDISSNINSSLHFSESSAVVATLNSVVSELNALKNSFNITVISELDGREIARGTYREVDRLNGLNIKKLNGVW